MSSTCPQAMCVAQPMMEWMGGMGWMVMVFMMLIWVLVIAAIVVGVVLLVRAIGGSGSPSARSGGSSEAMDILEERFARGEIDREEFEERRRTLRG